MKPLPPSTQALLQAVLPSEIDRQALERWLATTNLERLEPGQFHLLPLVYRQMEQTAVNHPWLPRLKGIHRRTWVSNQLAVRAARETLDLLAAADIPALLIGAVALALTVYADPTTRPIGAPQVLTRTSDRLAAIQTLTAGGWQPSPPTNALTAPCYERWQAGHLFTKRLSENEALQVRLCWHAAPSGPIPAWGAQWFNRSAPLTGESLQARTLDPTDQLFQSLAAAPALELIPLVDGQQLINRHPIDWTRFVRLAKDSRLTLMLRERLALMQTMSASQLPDRVLTELNHAISPDYADEAWRLDQLNPWERTAWQRFRLSYALFRQRAAAQGVAPYPGAFYDYLRTQMGTNSLAETLKRGLRRMTASPPLPHGY